MAKNASSLTAEQAQRLQKAFALLQQGHLKDALSETKAVALAAPHSMDAQHLLALCHKGAGDYRQAEVSFRQALALASGHPQVLGNYSSMMASLGRFDEALDYGHRAVSAAPASADARVKLGLVALDAGKPDVARQALERALQLDPRSASAWHALGNANRAEGDLARAEASFREAAKLNPGSGTVWVNLSVVVKLLGRPAEALVLLEEAQKTGFQGPELEDARSAALIDLGDVEEALQSLRRLTRSSPHYTAGHVTLAHLLWEYGVGFAPGEDPFVGFRKAADQQPGNGPLQLALVRFLMEAGRAEEALDRVRALRAASEAPALAVVEANALEALGRTEASAPLYEQLYKGMGVREPAFLTSYTRHLLKSGHYHAAAARAAETVELDPDNQEGWGYLGTAWRLLGDPREDWLCDYERTIGLVEVIPPEGYASQDQFIATLAKTLAPLHKATREPVNQSLRGGSQTPGGLFGRPDPVLEETQDAIRRAVDRHLAGLPNDPNHPFFRRKKRSVNFVGSWSVKLRSSGRHINHFHPQGWMSSAYYVSLPSSVANEATESRRSGWIQFGQPPEDLGLPLGPRRFIQPRPGWVALFPSYMWHGTVPFEDAEPRITMAFDMTPLE